MDHDRWNRLEALFLAALELELNEREEFLEKSCKGDEELKKELISMLAADEESMALSIENRLLSEDQTDTDLSGTHIGPYRLEKLIGEGGMGEVYLANRDDQQFDQKVALKRIRPAYRNRHMLARFRMERQVLAQLTHPNITQLLDGGLDQEGWPYLVMQYVEGIPITAYCDQNELTIEARIDLFRTVCSAVQHAHRNLVVHRDLKPANILVTNEGQVKLLDFGIAKLLNPDWSYSLAETQSQVRLMTPKYAAPEQVRGDVISTATDIYALGVLLYELLSGQKPYRFGDRLHAEIERLICEETPLRPSTAIKEAEQQNITESTAISRARSTGIGRLKRILQGDLDNIVLMAMRKEPKRRYASVEQLSQDLQHYLDGRPVVAQKDTLGYRLRKFTHRNRTAVVTSIALLLLLISFTTSTVIQSRVISEERDRAQVEAEKANQVSQFLLTLFDNADPNSNQGEPVTAAEIVREGAERIGNELINQPEIRADILEKLGRIHMRLGLLDESIDLFNESYNTRVSYFGDKTIETAFARTSMAEALVSAGRYDEADSLLDLSLTIQENQLHPTHKDIAASLNAKAIINYHKRNFEEAESYFERALSIWSTNAEDTDNQVIMAYSSLGAVQVALRNSEAAETNLRTALALANAAGMGNHTIMTGILNNLGHILMNRDQLEEADSLLTRSLNIRQHLFGENHQSMPVSYNNLAMLKRRRGLLEEAEDYAEKGLAIQKEIGGPNVGRAALNLGRIEVDRKKYDEAELHFQEAIRVLSEGFGEDHALTKQARDNLSELQAIRR